MDKNMIRDIIDKEISSVEKMTVEEPCDKDYKAGIIEGLQMARLKLVGRILTDH